MKLEFRNLRADEIDVRIGTANDKGVSLLLYKDARVDMNILDETIGQFNWQRDHKELKGNIYCGVSIWDNEKGQWITKWDCGKESNTEAEKGEASDSFKRACFNLGIGRELYTAPFIWIANAKKTDRFTLKTISYDNNGNINKLEILKGKDLVFTYPSYEKKVEPVEPKKVETEHPIFATEEQIQELVSMDCDIAKCCHYFGDIPTSKWDYEKTARLIEQAKIKKGLK